MNEPRQMCVAYSAGNQATFAICVTIYQSHSKPQLLPCPALSIRSWATSQLRQTLLPVQAAIIHTYLLFESLSRPHLPYILHLFNARDQASEPQGSAAEKQALYTFTATCTSIQQEARCLHALCVSLVSDGACTLASVAAGGAAGKSYAQITCAQKHTSGTHTNKPTHLLSTTHAVAKAQLQWAPFVWPVEPRDTICWECCSCSMYVTKSPQERWGHARSACKDSSPAQVLTAPILT